MFHCDELKIHRIVDYQGAMVAATTMFPELTEDVLAANRSWLRRIGALSPDDRIVLCFQSYLIQTPDHVVLVDACIGNDKERQTRPHWHHRRDEAYLRALARAGIAPAEVDFVLCTHLHVDHVGWNTRLENGRWVPTFPNARYLFSAKEMAFWSEQNRQQPVPHLIDSVLPVIEAGHAELVRNTHECSEHVRLISTPGHTVDHVSVAFGRNRDSAVVTGDLIHSPLQLRHPQLSMLRDFDPFIATATRRRFLERYAETETLCCAAHFPTPSVGRILRVPESDAFEMVAA